MNFFGKREPSATAHDDSEKEVPAGVDAEVLDEEPKSIILGLISQLKKGMDLHRVTLPTFVLEPRSMCERITDFMSHPELILKTHLNPNPEHRFVDVVRYFLSGWHIRPKGVKKPYNPVLGEIFRCKWQFDDKSESLYVCEQVSHHPPISAYHYASPENHLVIMGDIRPKSKFLGNSAATLMQGTNKVIFTQVAGNETEEIYSINLPNIYARGILFGTMYMELGDVVSIKCEHTGYSCELKFEIKGFFSGTYNGISGKIRDPDGDTVYTISGKWSEEIILTRHKCESVTLFNVATTPIRPKIVELEEEQEEYESRRLWHKVTTGLLTRNIDAATDEKTKIEDNQRVLTKARVERNEEWIPRFFKYDSANDVWVLNQTLPLTIPAAKQKLNDVIFSKPPSEKYGKFWRG